MFRKIVILVFLVQYVFSNISFPAVSLSDDSNYISKYPSCSHTTNSPNNISISLSSDPNQVYRYTGQTISIDFDVSDLNPTMQYAVYITSNSNFQYQINGGEPIPSNTCNHITAQISLQDNAPIQDIYALSFDSFELEIYNISQNIIEFSFPITILHSKYGIFLSYINQDVLATYYINWLYDNGFLSHFDYQSAVDNLHSSVPVIESNDTSIATATATASTEQARSILSYTVTPINSGASLLITGTVTWTDIHGTSHPARGILLEILERDTLSNESLGTVYTQSTGYFSITVPNQTGILENGGADLQIKVYIQSLYSEVADQYGSVSYFFVNCPDNISTQSASGTYEPTSSSTSHALYVQQALDVAANYIKAMSGDNTFIYSVFPASDLTGSLYTLSKVYIAESDFDSWDTIMHECGHFAADEYGIYPGAPYAHNMRDNLISYLTERVTISTGVKYDACKLAWQEGWATYFCISAQIHQNVSALNVPYAGDTNYEYSNPEYFDSIETNTSGTYSSIHTTVGKGEAHELAISRILWDIADIYNTTPGCEYESHDTFHYGFLSIWNRSMESGAKTFDDFAKYFLSTLSNTSPDYRNFGALLGNQQVAASSISFSAVNSQPVFTWSPAYSDENVSNEYYLIIFNSSMDVLYRIVPSSTTRHVLGATAWNNLKQNYSTGFYWCIQNYPDGNYNTGPYSSHIKQSIPS